MDFTNPYLLLTLIGLMSPLFLLLLPKGRVDFSSFFIGTVMFLGVAGLTAYVSDLAEVVWQFLFFQFLLFFSFVSVSRMRQRKSAFLHALASIPSNGQWFITMWVLSEIYLVNEYAQGVIGTMAFGREFLVLFAIAVVGTVAGRLVGVQWMQWVEARWEVTEDEVGSLRLRQLDKWTPNTLLSLVPIGLVVYGIWFPEMFFDACIVTALGLVQSGVGAINTRLANRNHPGWPVLGGHWI